MFTGAIKLLGTPVEKKWAGPCPVQKYELGSYIQFLTAHCPSPWFVSTEELFQFAAKKLMTSVSSTCNITKKKNILINELVTFRASKDLLYNYVFEQNEENILIRTNI